MNRAVVLAFLAVTGVVQAAGEQLCPAVDLHGNAAPPQGQQCPEAVEQPCDQQQVDDVSWFDWALGSHQMPSLHFVDFLELFVR